MILQKLKVKEIEEGIEYKMVRAESSDENHPMQSHLLVTMLVPNARNVEVTPALIIQIDWKLENILRLCAEDKTLEVGMFLRPNSDYIALQRMVFKEISPKMFQAHIVGVSPVPVNMAVSALPGDVRDFKEFISNKECIVAILPSTASL